ncbi:MAG: BamA/TamA family outer membrane protein, partial [Chitinophagaceae bacterium]|nr:BamA/TamA family outer membrane protein [Chitinophagaceae bacterium]
GHSFSSKAYRVEYHGEWIHVLGNTDLVINALVKAPNNTINFFGLGNETEFDKTGDFKRYYRTRFSTYQLDPAFRWRNKNQAISAGPSLYYYTYDDEDNDGRFITNVDKIGSYDSAIVDANKLHLGGAVEYTFDRRNRKMLPQRGIHVGVRFQAYKGIEDYTMDYAQLIPEFTFYKNLNRSATIVLADRIGGTIGIGNPAFYQSAFVGGHGNLLGYRQYRFAGQHSIYNNLEFRIKLVDVANYILPGQFGVTTFWDIGRVWVKHDNSSKLHHGYGGGIYFAPASIFVFNLVMGFSEEGALPYFTMGLRF